MADATQIEISRGATLATGEKKTAAPTNASTELKASVSKSNELIEFRNKNKPTIETFRSNLGRGEFSTNSREFVNAGLSGGEGRINNTTGKAELPTGASREAQEHSNRTKTAVDKISKAIDYTQILRDAARDGKNPKDIYSQPPYNLKDREWSNLRTETLDLLLKDGGITAKFSDELAGLNPDQQREYIDPALGSDPALNAKIIERMEEIRKEVEDLKAPQKGPDRVRLDADKTRTETALNNTYDILLRNANLDPASVEAQQLKAALEPFLTSGAPANEIQDQVARALISARGITNQQDYDAYDQASFKLQDKQTQIVLRQQLIKNLQSSGQQLSKQDQAQISRWNTEIATLTTELGTAGGKVNDIVGKLGLTSEEIEGKLSELKSIRENVYGINRPDGTTRGGIADASGRLVARYKEMTDINGKIEAADSSQEAMQERSQRLAEESNIITKLEGVLSGSIEDLLVQRHGELVILEGARLDKAIGEAQKAGDKWKEEALKKQKETMKTRWIDITNKKTITHKNNLQKDGQKVAQDGEDGAKEVYAECIGYSTNEITEKNKIAKELFGTRSRLTDSEKEQVNRTYKDRQEKFNVLYSEQGDAFKTKLLSDLFTARGLKERLGIGDILNNNEWKMLSQNFEEFLTKGLASSKEGQAALQKSREAGISVAPDSKRKWLIWALLGALGLAGLGTTSLSKSIS